MEDFNQTYEKYCDEGLYTNASNLLVDQAQNCIEKGDTLNAYKLQLKNCYLTDEHLEDFFKKGLTWEGYFANWYMTISIAAWLNMKEEMAPQLLRILTKISKKAPNLLPFYASSLGYILFEYKSPMIGDSILVLQEALNYIKSQNPSHELVKQYNEISECFYSNRFYNSFDGHTMYSDKLYECDVWFNKNKAYIDSLDAVVYKDEIVNYYTRHTEDLSLLASTLSAQYNKYEESLFIYEKCIEYLEKIKNLNDTIALKMASIYSKISSNYYILGDVIKSKEYCDKTVECLFQVRKSLDYCSVLSGIARNYWNLNQPQLAASFKKAEILFREETPMPPSCSDYTQYMMYNQFDTISTLILGEELEKKYDNSESSMTDVYRYMADAFSKIMHRAIIDGDKETADFDREKYEEYLKKSQDVFSSNKDYYDRFGLTPNVISNFYNTISSHYARIGDIKESFSYAEKALDAGEVKSYYEVSLKASAIQNEDAISKYLPRYYQSIETKLNSMLPILGSVESDTYLRHGESPLYHISEWASWNPTNSSSVSIAYDAALLMKGVTLRYNVLTPYYEKYPELVNSKLQLDRMRDSIYSIKDENTRFLALYKYQQKERDILKIVNNELTNIHWKDISHALKDNEACIEFVKYTKNAYNWSDGLPTIHYAALVLCPNTSTPIFVDLFDEDELIDVYNLQPKSYDNEMGVTLYSKLWGNLAKYIEKKDRVYFSPMGLLNLINIENLVDSIGRTAIERFNLYRVSSTRNIIEKKDYVGISSVASFGGVDYKVSNEYAELKSTMNTRGNWAFLQNTLSEVTHIKESLNSNGIKVYTFIGSDATENAFKDLDGTQSNIIHLATHGYYIPQSNRKSIPYFVNSNNTKNIQDELFYSGIVLSGGQKAWINSSFEPNSNDGILSSYEISKLDFHNVDLVVLSACESGLGDNLYDGIYGLQRAFKKAGVRSILMSLWQIDDKATSEYMDIFYKKLSEGSTIHDAYTSTVLEMKHRYPDPYYWASFIMLD